MRLPRDVSANDLVSALSRLDYEVTRQTGSHIRLTRPAPEHHVTVPNHSPIKVGTLSAIIKELSRVHNLDRDALLRKLFEGS